MVKTVLLDGARLVIVEGRVAGIYPGGTCKRLPKPKTDHAITLEYTLLSLYTQGLMQVEEV